MTLSPFKIRIFHLALLITGLGCLLTSCESEPPKKDLDKTSIQAALESCGDDPCIFIGPAFEDENAPLAVIPNGGDLGVFNAAQGGVATWVTIIAANVPDENPKMQIRVATEDALLNVPNTLKVPFEDVGDGIRVRLQYMVQFLAVCCASDHENLKATIEAKLYYEGCGKTPMTVGTCGKACQNDADCSTGYACTEVFSDDESTMECRLEPVSIEQEILLRDVPWPL